MNERTFNGFMLSAALHGLVAALLFVTFVIGEQASKTVPKVLELVAGEGDSYMATEAPALGRPGGIKVPITAPPPTKPSPREPAPVQAAPEPVVERAPVTPAATPAATKPPEAIRDFSEDVKRIQKKRADRLEAIDKKKRDAEERKAKEAELKEKRMTKADFDRQNKNKATPNSSSTKVAQIDAEGIARGVVGGSTANKTGGAGGKALTRDEGDELDLYFSLLKRRLKEALEKPPGLSDTLVAIAEVRIGADGTLSGAHIKRSSGSDEFDLAVLEAIARVHSVGPRPDHKSEVLNIPFRMREEEDEN